MGNEREGRARQCSEDSGLTQGPATTVGLPGMPGQPPMEGHAQSTGCSGEHSISFYHPVYGVFLAPGKDSARHGKSLSGLEFEGWRVWGPWRWPSLGGGQNLLSCREELGSTVWALGVEPMAYRANLSSRAATRSPSVWKSLCFSHTLCWTQCVFLGFNEQD